MNTKRRKTMIVSVMLVFAMLVSMTAAYAASSAYSGYVYKAKDMYDGPLTKSGTKQACFNITEHTSSTGNGKCTFWLEFSNGLDVSEKVTKRGPITKTTIEYDGTPSYYKGTDIYLRVSTSTTTLAQQYVKGRWSPDNSL